MRIKERESGIALDAMPPTLCAFVSFVSALLTTPISLRVVIRCVQSVLE